MKENIGDSYLKKPEFAAHPSLTKFQLKVPIQRQVLRSDPSIITRVIQQTPRFVIFGSDGLWDHLTNEKAVDIVNSHPRNGIAKRLLDIIKVLS
ncbi:protein phosphatase [Lithospermum erythrorhizon]|uniref:Protein phosphatase n=1 Tax=Lithospermum erythrorhizon TaxID=34254 RepID=A0AAV3Q1G3_LITER